MKNQKIIEKYKVKKKDLLWMYRNILMSRAIDDTEIKMKKNAQAFFQISSAGHEGIQTASAFALRAGYDQFLCYYREKAICLGLGVTPYEMLCQANGNLGDTASKGRQMPANMGNKKLNIVSRSSCTGSQFLQACGVSQANDILSLTKKSPNDSITYVSCGDGTVAQGEFWEGITCASVNNLRVLFMVQDNGYAISTPTWVGTPGGSISKALDDFPNLKIYEVDGNCPIQSLDTINKAKEHLIKNKGPVLIHARVTRAYSHSLSDDQKFYKSEQEIVRDKEMDVIPNYTEYLLNNTRITQKDLDKIQLEVKTQVSSARAKALKTDWPKAETSCDYLLSSEIDIKDESIFHEKIQIKDNEDLPMAKAINEVLKAEIKLNEQMIVFGQDIADFSDVKKFKDKNLVGKGGVFKVTSGLQKEAKDYQVFNSALAEASIVGRAVGMAMMGLRPVVEIQFFDYIWTAFMQLKNEMATTRYRSGGEYMNPMVVRTAIGGYVKGGALFHSQCEESIFTAIKGLHVAFPSNSKDAQGLLRTAMRADDPVMFFEHKHLYYQGYNRDPYQGDDYMIPFGKAKIVNSGSDLTIVTWGAIVQKSLVVASEYAQEGKTIEVIDLRTLAPYDKETILNSLKKTNRILIAHEASITCGFGAEIAAMVSKEGFQDLDAPVSRLGSKDCHIPYNPDLEDDILVQTEDVRAAVKELLAF
jgi:2-oxoisovalerate dehydrogenase E1 component